MPRIEGKSSKVVERSMARNGSHNIYACTVLVKGDVSQRKRENSKVVYRERQVLTDRS